jgi:hypothetical protein
MAAAEFLIYHLASACDRRALEGNADPDQVELEALSMQTDVPVYSIPQMAHGYIFGMDRGVRGIASMYQ